MSPEKQRIALPELMAMTDEELNRLAAELLGEEACLLWMPGPHPLMGMMKGHCSHEKCYPKYIGPVHRCGSRDLAFELRKGFTDEQHNDFRQHLYHMALDQCDIISGPHAPYRWMQDASARFQTIAAVMVLQQGGV
jgi:hypothetical protein